MIERLSWMKRMTFDLWPTGMTISREIPSTVRKKKVLFVARRMREICIKMEFTAMRHAKNNLIKRHTAGPVTWFNTKYPFGRSGEALMSFFLFSCFDSVGVDVSLIAFVCN
jgi:hypothetical protein